MVVQNCIDEYIRHRSPRTLSKGAWTGSYRCPATASYYHWNAQQQHSWSPPCWCLDCTQAQEHARICPEASWWSRMWLSLGAAFLASIMSGSHSENDYMEAINKIINRRIKDRVLAKSSSSQTKLVCRMDWQKYCTIQGAWEC